MRTGPAVRPVAPTTPPPIPVTTTPKPGDVVIDPDTDVITPGISDAEGGNFQCWDVPWTENHEDEKMILKSCSEFAADLCLYSEDYQGVLKAFGCGRKEWIRAREKYNETSVSAIIDILQ